MVNNNALNTETDHSSSRSNVRQYLDSPETLHEAKLRQTQPSSENMYKVVTPGGLHPITEESMDTYYPVMRTTPPN